LHVIGTGGHLQLFSCAIVGGVDEPVIVTRQIDLDVDAAELWPLVAEAGGWAEWLVGQANVDVAEGATGTVVDDNDVERAVRVDAVDPGSASVRFTWWPTGQPDGASTVELVVIPVDLGSRLRITEVQLRASASAIPAGRSWEWRAMALWTAVALARV
jgi:hypothetical protein